MYWNWMLVIVIDKFLSKKGWNFKNQYDINRIFYYLHSPIQHEPHKYIALFFFSTLPEKSQVIIKINPLLV